MIYRVNYSSMTACYGPSFIEADSELDARLKFAGSVFSRNELGLISAKPVSSREIASALRQQEDKS